MEKLLNDKEVAAQFHPRRRRAKSLYPTHEPVAGLSLASRPPTCPAPNRRFGGSLFVSRPGSLLASAEGGGKSSGGVSFREYLLQRPQRGGERLCRDYSQFIRQPGLVHGANLIEQDQTLPATMIDAARKHLCGLRHRR